MRKLTVNTSPSYDVQIGKGLIASLGESVKKLGGISRTAVISDSNVFPLYGAATLESLSAAGLQASSHVLEAGEKSKSLSAVQGIYDFLGREGVTRTDVVVALGGGVVGDAAGFAAATYLRGVRFVQVPTTVLAMCDSSVGGKTGVDIPAGKNLVGAFHQPSLVLADTDTLKTLPPREYSSGMAEVIKYAAIASAPMFDELESGNFDIENVVAESVKIKRFAVENDPFDRGIRQMLNFGHTLGHAAERHSAYMLSHGYAVSAGMCMITRLSERAGLTDAGTAERLEALAGKFGLMTKYPLSAEELFKLANSDKKRKGDRLTLALIPRIGEYILSEFDFAALEGGSAWT